LQVGTIAAILIAALGVMLWTEFGAFASLLFLLSWGLINFLFLVLCRRPTVSAALSLALVLLIVALSQFKFGILWMTINFFDVLIVDSDSVAFLLAIFPDLRTSILIGVFVGVPVLGLLWWIDGYRVPRLVSAAGVALCSLSVVALSLAVPEQPSEPFQGVNHVSGFMRSGAMTAYELATRGWIDADDEAVDRLNAAAAPCQLAQKPPHIVMVLDEASFDISTVPHIKVPEGYARHFKSPDGHKRTLIVEGSGGPTWYTEYNVLTGLSARSYGRMSFYVTRIAAGRVERGLPQALRRCGYKTVSLYPAYGAFLSARKFQTTTGVERFIDAGEMRAGDVEPDSFYYAQALRLIAEEREDKPLFIFVYTVANHFPWDYRYRPDLTPEDWRDPGNDAEVDEYLRRQAMSARDYADFVARLRDDHADQSFLLVRFGDHQPALSQRIVDPLADDQAIAQRLAAGDLRYHTTYYAIEGVNTEPVDLSSALDRLEAPYLPLVVQEAAGLPLDPSFAEQKRILKRCGGLFFLCAEGAEARRFNRLLIEAGLIKGMVSR
jgi:hypothetical protein